MNRSSSFSLLLFIESPIVVFIFFIFDLVSFFPSFFSHLHTRNFEKQNNDRIMLIEYQLFLDFDSMNILLHSIEMNFHGSTKPKMNANPGI